MTEVKKDEKNHPEKAAPQEDTFNQGPLLFLTKALKTNCQIVISCRHNRKLLGKLRAFDRHMNMVLEDVTEIWTEKSKGNKGKKTKPKNRERTFNKLFLRGDSIILIVRNPH